MKKRQQRARPALATTPANDQPLLSPDADPLEEINRLLVNQVLKLLRQIDKEEGEITIPQRINGLKAASTILVVFHKLKEAAREPEHEPGSAVRQYTEAFQSAYASTRRATDSGPTAVDTILADLDGDDSAGDEAA